jgi:NAD(P)-dependent dehydrogenase (short-subunit alcohol dehydrogenase family)
MASKTVIITGANGNLGTTVVKKFLRNGYRVVATVMNESMLDAFESHEHLEVCPVDLASEKIRLLLYLIRFQNIRTWKLL